MPEKRGDGGGSHLGSSLLGHTVMVVTVLCVAFQAAYTICHDEITVQVLIYIPSNTKISKSVPEVYCCSNMLLRF